jgi:hypothetical protein
MSRHPMGSAYYGVAALPRRSQALVQRSLADINPRSTRFVTNDTSALI